jgi:hypothetical protein
VFAGHERHPPGTRRSGGAEKLMGEDLPRVSKEGIPDYERTAVVVVSDRGLEVSGLGGGGGEGERGTTVQEGASRVPGDRELASDPTVLPRPGAFG